MKVLILMLSFLTHLATAGAGTANRSLASIRQNLRVEHARELMGPSYKRSIVSRFENREDMERQIHRIVDQRLPEAYKSRAYIIAKTIIHEASTHSLDPYFVMAVISGESSFNPKATGPVGEIGLMQIRYNTGKWMAAMLKMPWRGKDSLNDPITNIKLGTAYLGWLREKFSGHGQLYLAAYNMGPGSVKKALSRKIYPKDYPIHVMKRYIAFYKELKTEKTL